MKRKEEQAIKMVVGEMADIVVLRRAKASGECFEAQLNYFYRHGRTPEKLATTLELRFDGVKPFDCGDHYAIWPKRSYFWIRFTVENPESFVERAIDTLVVSTNHSWAEVWEMTKLRFEDARR